MLLIPSVQAVTTFLKRKYETKYIIHYMHMVFMIFNFIAPALYTPKTSFTPPLLSLIVIEYLKFTDSLLSEALS